MTYRAVLSPQSSCNPNQSLKKLTKNTVPSSFKTFNKEPLNNHETKPNLNDRKLHAVSFLDKWKKLLKFSIQTFPVKYFPGIKNLVVRFSFHFSPVVLDDDWWSTANGHVTPSLSSHRFSVHWSRRARKNPFLRARAPSYTSSPMSQKSFYSHFAFSRDREREWAGSLPECVQRVAFVSHTRDQRGKLRALLRATRVFPTLHERPWIRNNCQLLVEHTLKSTIASPMYISESWEKKIRAKGDEKNILTNSLTTSPAITVRPIFTFLERVFSFSLSLVRLPFLFVSHQQ